jgi:hypothetical protein
MLTDFFVEQIHPKVFYELTLEKINSWVMREIVKPSCPHDKVDSFYGLAIHSSMWKNMHPDQAEEFCKKCRIACKSINRKYGVDFDIIRYHFPGVYQHVCRKYGPNAWDSGL